MKRTTQRGRNSRNPRRRQRRGPTRGNVELSAAAACRCVVIVSVVNNKNNRRRRQQPAIFFWVAPPPHFEEGESASHQASGTEPTGRGEAPNASAERFPFQAGGRVKERRGGRSKRASERTERGRGSAKERRAKGNASTHERENKLHCGGGGG